MAEILGCLFFKHLKYDPKNPMWEERDKLVLSKGHASPGLFSNMAVSGYFETSEMQTLRQFGSRLQGHPDLKCPGVEFCGGSLGIGLSYSIGNALAAKLDEYFEGREDVEVRKMFGGLCYMLSSHMCCGIIGETLIARVGPDSYSDCLAKQHVKEMDFTGKAMKGMVCVSPDGIKQDSELAAWLGFCEKFVKTLPPKKQKDKK